MNKPKRKYSATTVKVLFALSGNRCAYPGCKNPVILPPTKESDFRVLNQICHIYALSEDGPRGKAGLTEDELNAPSNLILFCPTHHVIVDAQHETYPAELLKQWKTNHDENIQKRLSMDLANVNTDVFAHPYFPKSLVDQKINEDIEVIRKSRFFVEFDRVTSSLILARRILVGELSGGSDAVKSTALAWCARFLVYTDELYKAEEYLKDAKKLGSCPEVKIADAFICSHKGDKNTALNILAGMDSPISRSAALLIMARHDGPQAAVDWLKTAGINTADLDPEGKYFLLTLYLQLAEWEAAKRCLDVLTHNDLFETPILHHMVAITYLLSTVPEELCNVVFNQIPFEAASFPLAADATAIKARRIARQHFITASEIAQQLNCLRAATISAEYALWLELKDPDESDKGMKKLHEKLCDTKSALRLVHLGLQFGIKLDLDIVEKEIQRQIALNGGITQDAAIARFALAFTQKTPEDVLSYITRHRHEINKYFNKKSIEFLQIEMLSKAGLPEKAKEYLNTLVDEGLSSAEESRLRRVIAEAEGTNPVEARKEQFMETGSLGDLVTLVNELETREDWDGLCEYGQILYEKTRSLDDAERFAKALANTQRDGQLIKLLKANSDLLLQSRNLQMLYSWSLYYEGKLLEARAELAKMNEDWGNPNYRGLQVNLAIAIGNWNSLATVVANECLEKEKRSAQELLSVAQLALHLGLPQAKELTFAAADKGNDDAHILAAAYLLATSAGWESDAEVFQWLNKAATLSGDDGPIHKKSMKDLVNMKPDWDRREAETWRLLNCGDIPMFLAAESLNKSLIQMMLFPALANQLENDPRRRGAVPAYSGARPPVKLNTGGAVAMDTTALLTLSLLNLLDDALDAFETVRIPHSTLAWLFEEKQRAAFHQPRRIKDAHNLLHLIAKGILQKLLPKTVPDGELSQQVGDGLAVLIAEAEKSNEDNGTQHIVVRPSPVHRVSSLMEEEADLNAHAAVLCSCMAIVDKLREKGQITAEEEEKARVYIQIQEKPWPNQPDITDGAVLYLDDLAIAYFLHIGILEKLHAAGFRLIASPREVSEAIEITSYEGISDKVNDAIERIRSAIHKRIESETIKVGRMHNPGDIEEQSISRHPTVSLIDLATDCDAIIVDDRFLNKHDQVKVNDGNVKASIYSTSDLIDALVSMGSITYEKRLECRTLLRRAGYLFMPIDNYELTHYLHSSSVIDSVVIETAELKAIRESILRVRMSNWLQLPQEARWIDEMIKTFIRVLTGLWRADIEFSKVRVFSDWIIGQIDARGWAHSLGGENGVNLVKVGRGNHILLLIMPLKDISIEVQDNYWSWVEVRVLAPIKEQNPDLYLWIIEWHRRFIAETADKVQEESGVTGIHKSVMAMKALDLVSPLIRKSLLEDADFRKEYDLRTSVVVSFGESDVSVQRSDLFEAIRMVLSGIPEKEVTDTEGRKWKIKNISREDELPVVALSCDKERLILENFAALSPDSNIRLLSLNKDASCVNLPSISRDIWHNVLSERALEEEEVDVFYSEFRDTPVGQAQSIHNEAMSGHFSMSSLVPCSHRYYERLVGVYDNSVTISDYAVGSGRTLFKQLSAWQPYDGFLFSLLLSSHFSLTAEINIDELSSEDLVRALDFLVTHGDRTSQLGAVEVGLRVLPLRPEIEPILINLVEQICSDDIEGKDSGFKLFSALFILVYGELSRFRLFTSEPPFYRRLAALSQGALAHRQLVASGVDIDLLYARALSNHSGQYYMQSFADMRVEPYWDPDYAEPSQMKANFIGRIMFAAKNYEQNIKGSKLYDLILGSNSKSLFPLDKSLLLFLPGPLEGVERSTNTLPDQFSEIVWEQLAAQEVGPSSFTALVNSARIFRVGSDQADFAAKVLKHGNYRLSNLENRTQLISILFGLAAVAAVTRSYILADELRILVRIYRRDAQYPLSIEESMRICLVAASSRANLDDWRDFVGEWFADLAFSDLKTSDGEMLHSYLQYLCHAVPEVWVSCGRADAALMAYNAIR